MPEIVTIAVCLSDEVTLSDFIPPVEILAGINLADHPFLGAAMGEVAIRVAFEYIAPTLNPVVSLFGKATPTFNPTMTYKDAIASGKQFDIIWVPAGKLLCLRFLPFFADNKLILALRTGPPADPTIPAGRIPQDEIDFIKQQTPNAKYVLSVCGGAYQLALAGVLSGKRATTNKQFFRIVEAMTPKDIEWVAKARWVIDGKIWTSSGVAAGSDMALAFVEHITNARVAKSIRGGIEIPEAGQDDDPFAAIHGLV
ncbi:DJ-1 protein-PfpI domain-containing protein [Mycena chlorophos]|uniref:DJ-1 protein-PfpI domain-containing protein n=1 Tax=Mycena chlorophos TaxID=658473 RepID=A0A8H6THD4_MYCCL|nr:DJ-1 protein-PfpI domain-containing protein [Mycena chlorophos]